IENYGCRTKLSVRELQIFGNNGRSQTSHLSNPLRESHFARTNHAYQRKGKVCSRIQMRKMACCTREKPLNNHGPELDLAAVPLLSALAGAQPQLQPPRGGRDWVRHEPTMAPARGFPRAMRQSFGFWLRSNTSKPISGSNTLNWLWAIPPTKRRCRSWMATCRLT